MKVKTEVNYDGEKRLIESVDNTLMRNTELFDCVGISCKDCKLLYSEFNDGSTICLAAEFKRTVNRIIHNLE